MKSLSSLKAITIYDAARSLSVNAAVAKLVLSSLESKGLVKTGRRIQRPLYLDARFLGSRAAAGA